MSRACCKFIAESNCEKIS